MGNIIPYLRGRQQHRKKKGQSRRFPLHEGLALADQVLERLTSHQAVIHCSCAGSLRRMEETIGDLDLIAVTNQPEQVIEAFLSLNQWARWRTVDKGEYRKAIAYTAEKIRVALWVVSPVLYGVALLALSGCAFHVDAMYKRYLKLTYGNILGTIRHWCSSFSSHEDLLVLLQRTASKKIETTEESLYESLGMQWVPPPLRRGGDEIKAAIEKRIPRLLELSDIHGQIQRTSAADISCAEFRRLAFAAADQGYEFFAVIHTHIEHSSSARWDAALIRNLNQELGSRLSILYGIEIEVSPNGEVSYPFSNLEGIDFVVASVGVPAGDSKKKLMRTLLQAVEHPDVNMIRCRDLQCIKNFKVDLDAVFQRGARHEVAFEVEISPSGLSLESDVLRRAMACGADIGFSIRGLKDFSHMRVGVGAAQRAWASAEHVINTWPLERLGKLLRKNRRNSH